MSTHTRAPYTTAKGVRRLQLAGMEVGVLVPGGYYQCLKVGGFTDSLTGITIPGPKALIDDTTKRNVVGYVDIPDPVQIPHLKAVVEVSDSGKVRKEVETDFNAGDEQPIHEAFQLALSTGILRYVPDEEVEAKYPRAWEKRQSKIVYRSEAMEPVRSDEDMFMEAEADGRFVGSEVSAAIVAETKAKIAERNSLLDAEPLRPPRPAPPRPPRPSDS